MGDLKDQSMKLAERLREARFALNLSMRQLSERTNPRITHAAIHLYESGKAKPRLDTLQNIAEALGVSVEELQEGKKGIHKYTMLWRKKSDKCPWRKKTDSDKDLGECEALLAEQLNQYLEIASHLEQFQFIDTAKDHLSKLRVPKFYAFSDSFKEAIVHTKPSELRKKLKIQSAAIYSISQILENNNMIIIPLDAPRIIQHLFCYIPRTDHPFKNSIEVVPLSSRVGIFRQRAVMAYKLMHRLLDSGFGAVLGCGNGYQGDGTSSQREEQDKFEDYLDVMTLEFLIPKKLLEEEIAKMKNLIIDEKFSVGDIMHLRDVFGVPIKVVIDKLSHYDKINKENRADLLNSKLWDLENDTFEGDLKMDKKYKLMSANKIFSDFPQRLLGLITDTSRKGHIDEKELDEIMNTPLMKRINNPTMDFPDN